MVFDIMVKIVIFSIIAVIFILVLKPVNAHLALILTLLTAIIVFLFITPFLNEVISFFNTFTNYIDFQTLYIDVILKIIAVCYICEIGAEICKDAGINAVASKIEISGKVLIMVLSLPIISEILKTVVRIL